jgi:hypothetical protein
VTPALEGGSGDGRRPKAGPDRKVSSDPGYPNTPHKVGR